MKLRHYRLGVVTLLVAAVMLALWSAPEIRADRADDAVRLAGKMLTSKNPDKRAEGVEACARANNKAGAIAVMRTLRTEKDGPAGYRMASAVAQFSSAEALEVIEKTVLKWTKPDTLFGAYWCFIGLCEGNTALGDVILKKAMLETKAKEHYIKAAAIEAIGYTGRSDLAGPVADVLKEYKEEWDTKGVILGLTAIHAAGKLGTDNGDKELTNRLVLALANVLRVSKADRMRWFAAKALSDITGEDTYISPEFWEWWVKAGGVKLKSRPEGATMAGRDVPKFFKAAAVGKRVVFVIDISGSMQHPVNLPPEMRKPPPKPKKKKRKKKVTSSGSKHGEGDAKKDKEEEKEPLPKPDYSRVKSKLDLAKVELIHTLKYLPADYKFNIVIYHTPHGLIDTSVKGLIPATEANKRRMIKKVQGLHWANLTNIHGALMDAFCLSDRGFFNWHKTDPASDTECLNSGATTIFFLTDGSPTISDDTTDKGKIGRPGGPMRGNGRMVIPQNIIDDIKRVNTFRKVVIHTIGIGPHNGQLLGALARMSGGEYIDRSGVAPK